MLAVRWCEVCQGGRTCLVNGRCAKGVRPTENAAALRGVGTLTIIMRHAPAVAHNALTGALTGVARASISASLGATTVASLSRVVFQDGGLSAFELWMPSAAAGGVVAEVSVQPAGAPVPSIASFPFAFFDDSISLNCFGCRAPSSGGAPFLATITNFLLSEELLASDQLSATFGTEVNPNP